MKKANLSVVLATRNEEENIARCLGSVKPIADEIIIMDEYSEDDTCKIAKEFGAKVFKVKHEEIFHKTKQKALEKARGDWILQLDADEKVTKELANEIRLVISLSNNKLKKRKPKNAQKDKLFKRHQRIIEERDGKVGKNTGEIVAFFLPRLNYFLGKPLRYAGVYPDANIRLVKRGKARFPAKSVHEQMQVDGEVSWLFNDLAHYDSPTLKRYIKRANRYTDLKADEFKEKKVSKNIIVFFYYTLIKPTLVFIRLFIRHKGILDGTRGFLWSIFSAWHFPIAYYKYMIGK